MECLDCQCTNMMEVEESSDGKNYMCEDCGSEQSEIDWKFRGYKVGKVLSVGELKSPLKKCMVQVSEKDELQIVTNTKHVAQGDIVVVATIGAIVPAGADPEEEGGQGVVVKSATVGGSKSDGMLCDGVMLQWAGGSKGVLVKLKEAQFTVGATPPAKKPISS